MWICLDIDVDISQMLGYWEVDLLLKVYLRSKTL